VSKITWQVELEFLAAIVQGSSQLDTYILEYVEPGYFAVESYKWLVKQLAERSWKPFPIGFLSQLLLESFPNDSDKRDLYYIQLEQVFNKSLEFVEEAESKFRTFISFNLIKVASKNAFDNFERSGRIDYLLDEISERAKDAKNVITKDRVKIVDYAENYEDRMAQRREIRDNPDISPIIKTGIPGLDSQFQIRAPQLVDFLAPFKRYKSIILNTMGFSSLMQGYNVLHLMYENTIGMTAGRYDSLFSTLSYDRLSDLAITSEEKDKIDNLFLWVNSWSSRLKLLKCIPKRTTILEVEEEIEKLKFRENFTPDVIILDYLNIVKSSIKEKEERLQQQIILWDIKNMAEKYNVPIFTASQANMGANKVARMDNTHRGKSIDISQGLDLSIAIDQTPEEREDGFVVLSPLFSRWSKIEIEEVVCETDLNRMSICKSFREIWDIANRVHK